MPLRHGSARDTAAAGRPRKLRKKRGGPGCRHTAPSGTSGHWHDGLERRKLPWLQPAPLDTEELRRSFSESNAERAHPGAGRGAGVPSHPQAAVHAALEGRRSCFSRAGRALDGSCQRAVSASRGGKAPTAQGLSLPQRAEARPHSIGVGATPPAGATTPP